MPLPYSQKDLNQFEAWGVPMPKHTDHYNEDQMEAIVKKQQTSNHTWFQEGNDVHCRTCINRHGGYCLPNQILDGVDPGTGMPTFKTIDF